jgi:excisionase family DNA binding protein
VIGGSNQLFTLDETARFLGVHPKTLYKNWRKWGLKGIQVGRAIKFRDRDVEAWLQENEAE